MFAFLLSLPITQPILLALGVTLSVFLIDPDKRALIEAGKRVTA